MLKGELILYLGDGEGKTLAAIGHAVRIAGHGKRAAIFHFLKGRPKVGEYNFLKKSVHVELCGAPQFLQDSKSRKAHEAKVRKGFDNARKLMGKAALVVLDEILYAVGFGLIDEEELLELLRSRGRTHVIVTGRKATEAIVEEADIVTDFVGRKHHFDKDRTTVVGIDW